MYKSKNALTKSLEKKLRNQIATKLSEGNLNYEVDVDGIKIDLRLIFRYLSFEHSVEVFGNIPEPKTAEEWNKGIASYMILRKDHMSLPFQLRTVMNLLPITKIPWGNPGEIPGDNKETQKLFEIVIQGLLSSPQEYCIDINSDYTVLAYYFLVKNGIVTKDLSAWNDSIIKDTTIFDDESLTFDTFYKALKYNGKPTVKLFAKLLGPETSYKDLRRLLLAQNYNAKKLVRENKQLSQNLYSSAELSKDKSRRVSNKDKELFSTVIDSWCIPPCDRSKFGFFYEVTGIDRYYIQLVASTKQYADFEEDWLNAFIKREHSFLETAACLACNALVTSEQAMATLNASIERSDKSLAQQTEKYKVLKKDLSSSHKEVKELSTKLAHISKDNENKQKYINELLKTDVTSVQDLEKRNNELSTAVDSLNETCLELRQGYNRQQRDAESLREKNTKLKDALEQAETNLERFKTGKSDAVVDGASQGIPIETYLSLIQDKRISIIGGNMMFAEIEKLGLKDCRCHSANEATIPLEALINRELIVIVTTYNSHKLSGVAKSAAQTHGIPIIYINSTNVNLFIIEAFRKLYEVK
ncbi:MAG: hypothetical protein RSC43_00355 [Clostridia bacterium]